MSIVWREAGSDDRLALQTFRCTDPAPREPGQRPRPHPRPWERDVEKAIHRLGTGVPTAGMDGITLLGFEANELVAVVTWVRLLTPGEVPLVKLTLLAVAADHRTRAGLGVGETAAQTISEAIRRVRDMTPGAVLFGLVDHRNTASKRLMAAAGFVHDPAFPVSDRNLEAWLSRL